MVATLTMAFHTTATPAIGFYVYYTYGQKWMFLHTFLGVKCASLMLFWGPSLTVATESPVHFIIVEALMP